MVALQKFLEIITSTALQEMEFLSSPSLSFLLVSLTMIPFLAFPVIFATRFILLLVVKVIQQFLVSASSSTSAFRNQRQNHEERNLLRNGHIVDNLTASNPASSRMATGASHRTTLCVTSRNAASLISRKNELLQDTGSQELLSQDHIETIASRNWKSVLAWITFHPDELRWGMDRKHQTALHHACLFRAPTHVLDMMLYQAPELAHVQNEDGEIALHWAVRVGAPNQVIELLLSAHPTSGILAKDKEGNTPLSLLWERHQDQLEKELDHDLQQRTEWKRLEMLLRYYHNYINSSTTNAAAASNCAGSIVVDTDFTETSFRPLHLVASCPCPPSLFRLVYRCYSDSIKDCDDEGRLPLACACLDASANLWGGSHDDSNARTNNYRNSSSNHNTTHESDAPAFSKVQFLVTVYPAAARKRDYHGRIPLFWALESGITWEEGVSELLAAYPKSVLLRDPQTFLLPFQLGAAAVPLGRRFCRVRQRLLRNDEETKNHLQPARQGRRTARTASLSTVYRLLRSDPGRQIGKFK